MSDTQTDAILAALRTRQRDLELDACAVRARVEEVAELIAMLEPRRRTGKPRNASALNPVPSQHADLQQTLDIVPQRVEGGLAATQTDLPSLDDVRGVLKEDVA